MNWKEIIMKRWWSGLVYYCSVCLEEVKTPHSTSQDRKSFGRHLKLLDCVWNVTAHAQKPDFFFPRNGRVHLNRQGRQFSRLLAAKVCASAVVMLDTPRSEVVWRVLATHSIRQFPLHFPSRASPCAITFQLDSTTQMRRKISNHSFSTSGLLTKSEVKVKLSVYLPWRHMGELIYSSIYY